MKITLPDANADSTSAENELPSAVLDEDFLEISSLNGRKKWNYNIQKERDKWKQLGISARFRYFRDYYAKITIIAIIAIACAIGIGINIYHNMLPTDLRLAILNTEYSQSRLDALEAEYRNTFSIPANHKIEFAATLQIHYSTYLEDIATTDPSTASSYEILTSYVRSDYLDSIITDEDGLQYLIEMDLIYNLNNLLPSETLEALEPYIIYATIPADSPDIAEDDAETISVPIALDIHACKTIAAFALPYENAYLTFPCASQKNLANAARLIEFLFGAV